MSASPPPIEAALNRWRSNLIDLSRRNPLIGKGPHGLNVNPAVMRRDGNKDHASPLTMAGHGACHPVSERPRAQRSTGAVCQVETRGLFVPAPLRL